MDEITKKEEIDKSELSSSSSTPIASTDNKLEQLRIAIDDSAKRSEKFQEVIQSAIKNSEGFTALPDEFFNGIKECGNILAFDGQLYTVKRDTNGVIEVENISKKLLEDAENKAKLKQRQDLTATGSKTPGTKGGKRRRTHKEKSVKSLEKMSKKELIKMAKTMKKM